MDLRTEPLAPEAEYFLDGALENYEMDTSSYLALRLYGGRLLVNEVVARGGHEFRGVRVRQSKCAELMSVADGVLAELPAEISGGLIFRGLAEIPRRMNDLGEVFADWALTDETEGGAMLPFRRGADIRLTRDGRVTKGVARRIRSRGFIRRYVRRAQETQELRAMMCRHVARVAVVPSSYLVDTHGAIEAAFRRQIEVERNRGYLAMVAAKDKPNRGLEHKRRKIVKRAACSASAVVGTSAVGAFARGEQVQLRGIALVFIVERRAPLFQIGHGAVAVQVADSGGAELARLCVYFERTPALDQLTALALFVQSGLENEILDKANVINATAVGLEHPLIGAKLKPVLSNADGTVLHQLGRGWSSDSYEKKRTRVNQYWAETKTVWIEEMIGQIAGPQRPVWQMLTEVMRRAA